MIKKNLEQSFLFPFCFQQTLCQLCLHWVILAFFLCGWKPDENFLKSTEFSNSCYIFLGLIMRNRKLLISLCWLQNEPLCFTKLILNFKNISKLLYRYVAICTQCKTCVALYSEAHLHICILDSFTAFWSHNIPSKRKSSSLTSIIVRSFASNPPWSTRVDQKTHGMRKY